MLSKNQFTFKERLQTRLSDELYNASVSILGKLSGNRHHIQSVNNLVHALPEKYKQKHQIPVKVFSHQDEIQSFLKNNDICALVHQGNPHFTPIIKFQDKILIFTKNPENFDFLFSHSDNLYILDPQIFKKPPKEAAQDEEVIDYQSDDVSCGIIAKKIIKNLLKDKGNELQNIIFDDENKYFYPSPIVFKQSQSNIFLEYYLGRYTNKMSQKNLDYNPKELVSSIKEYRDNHFSKARIFFYNLKYFEHIRLEYGL